MKFPKIVILLTSLGTSFSFAQEGPGWGANGGNRASEVLSQISPISEFTAPGPRGAATPSPAEEESGPSITPMAAITAAADEITPEIQDLANGLENDPIRIFNHVFNHIKYDHYFGSKKGAMMTMLEGRGNSFDTAALMVSLLRASGHTAEYRYGPARYTFDELANWCGFKTTPFAHLSEAQFRQDYDLVGVNVPVADLKKFIYVFNFNDRRGYPYSECIDLGFGANYWFIPHVWVRVTVGGQTFEIDPSFKLHTYPLLTDVKTLNSYVRTDFLSSIGGTDLANYTTGILGGTLAGNLTTLTTNLRNWVKANNPSMQTNHFNRQRTINLLEIANFNEAWGVISETRAWLGLSTWTTTIPSSFISKYEIQAGSLSSGGVFTPGSFSTSIQMPALKARKMALTFSGNTASIQLDDAAWETFTVSGATVDLRIKAVHNAFNYSYNSSTGTWSVVGLGRTDQQEIKRYTKSNSNAYNFVYGFDSPEKHLRKRQEQLDKYRRQGLADTDPRVKTEILNVMGLTWLMQTRLSDTLVGAQLDVSWNYNHRFGRVAQESNYFIDVGLQIVNLDSATGIETDRSAFLAVASIFGSAMEHGVMEQLQGSNADGASTVKMLHLANSNNVKIFKANTANWYGGSGVRSQLDNYPTAVLDRVEDAIDRGGFALIPEAGNQLLNTWTGYGYATIEPLWVDLGITGGLKGGFNTFSGQVDTFTLAQWLASDPAYLWAASALLNIGAKPATTPSFLGADPVEMATGAFVLEKNELSIGGAGPRGLNFTRHYHSGNRYNTSGKLGAGWSHNNDIYISQGAGIKAGLGETTVAHMSPYLTAVATATDIYRNGTKTPKQLTTVALIAKWAVDQLRSNGVGVSIGNQTFQFVAMPDGSYEPPAGQKKTLEKIAGNFVLKERHSLTYNFDSSNNHKIDTIVDQWGNTLDFDYSGGNLSTVTDCFNRTLTYNYTSGRISSITDGVRTVSLSYTGDTLTTATDAEAKAYGYTYDGENRITILRDPDNRIITQNTYDSASRVNTQKSMGDANRLWRFFYTGYCSIEQNPEGGQTVYLYDERGRSTSTTDPLGNYELRFYDGQDRITAHVAPDLGITDFEYDANHNLLTKTDTLGDFTDYFYDAQGRIRTIMDENGHETVHLYTDEHMPQTITDPEGNVTTYNYTNQGLLESVMDAENKTTTYAYDSTGTVNKVTFHDATFTTYTNNARGDILTATDAEGRVVTTTWNNRRQLLTTTLPAVLGEPAAIVTNVYDNCGNLQSKQDAKGNVTSFTYNALGKLVDTVEPTLPAGGNTLTKQYDLRDWLVSSKNSLNHQVGFERDAAGRIVGTTDALSRTTESVFDANGNALESKDPLNRVSL